MTAYHEGTDEAQLLHAALGEGRASISEMLKCVSRLMDSFGCVLWQAHPDSVLDPSNPKGALFVLASWFPTPPEQIFAIHDLSFDSATGRAVLTRAGEIEANLRASGGKTNSILFFDEHAISPMCTVPLTYADGSRGALNVYRTIKPQSTTDGSAGEFNECDLVRLTALAKLVPTLYAATRDRESLKLVQSIDAIFNEARTTVHPDAQSAEQIRSILRKVCEAVAKTFHSLEVSLILQDRHPKTANALNQSAKYEVQASTWDAAVEQPSYDASEDDGITGWVLSTASAVHLFDLLDLTDNERKQRINERYPNLNWKKHDTFPDRVRKRLGLKPDYPFFPPLSFMAAPVMSGTTLLGVLRCSTASIEPYYYSHYELSMLKLVTPLIGRYWETWLDSQAWIEMSELLNTMNKFAREELAKPTPNITAILQQAVSLPQKLLDDTQLCGIRLRSPDAPVLRARVFDENWPPSLSSAKIYEIKQKEYSLSSSESMGVAAVNTGELQIEEYTPDSKHPFWELGIKHALHAPIKVGNEMMGVVDVRSRSPSKFRRHAEAFVSLLGGQIGLYLKLEESIRQIRQNEADSKEEKRETTQRFQDLAHQLRGPINQLKKRSQIAIESRQPEIDKEPWYIIRGLSRKAWQAAMSMNIFAAISQSRMPVMKVNRIDKDWLFRTTLESCMDQQAVTDPARKLRFLVEKEDIAHLDFRPVHGDEDLLTQMIGNLIDNAFKYAYSNTMIRVVYRISNTGRFCISVLNCGLKINGPESTSCKSRGWRSPEAQLYTGEGSGIGLWIVDHIMKAHRGDLIVVPTNDHGITEVILAFPIQKKEIL